MNEKDYFFHENEAKLYGPIHHIPLRVQLQWENNAIAYSQLPLPPSSLKA